MQCSCAHGRKFIRNALDPLFAFPRKGAFPKTALYGGSHEISASSCGDIRELAITYKQHVDAPERQPLDYLLNVCAPSGGPLLHGSHLSSSSQHHQKT